MALESRIAISPDNLRELKIRKELYEMRTGKKFRSLESYIMEMSNR